MVDFCFLGCLVVGCKDLAEVGRGVGVVVEGVEDHIVWGGESGAFDDGGEGVAAEDAAGLGQVEAVENAGGKKHVQDFGAAGSEDDLVAFVR